MKGITILFTILIIASCENKITVQDKASVKGSEDSSPAITRYEVDLSAWGADFSTWTDNVTQGSFGTCSFSPDNQKGFYDKTDPSYTGFDNCSFSRTASGCTINLEINFGDASPEFVVGAASGCL